MCHMVQQETHTKPQLAYQISGRRSEYRLSKMQGTDTPTYSMVPFCKLDGTQMLDYNGMQSITN